MTDKPARKSRRLPFTGKPTRILSCGFGVQSSTLLFMAAEGEIEPFDAVIFADTQAEAASLYKWVDWCTERQRSLMYEAPIYRVTAGSLTNDTLKLRTSGKSGQKYIRALVPAYFDNGKGGRGLLGRKCTAEYKVRALLRKQRELAKVPRGSKDLHCLTAIGISWDEAHRMKPSKEPWAQNYWPLIDLKMTRQDCKDWLAKHGYPEPPRSACVYCPFHADHEWMRLRDQEPEEFARAVEFDKALREIARQATGTARLAGDVLVHSSLKPLDQVKFSDVPEKLQVNLFGNECEGLCGV